jgi:hypothetical protein
MLFQYKSYIQLLLKPNIQLYIMMQILDTISSKTSQTFFPRIIQSLSLLKALDLLRNRAIWVFMGLRPVRVFLSLTHC